MTTVVPPPSRPQSAAALAWLAHPVTVLAIVLLAVNDHVLKLAYPGFLTGKVSDVAGLLVAPPALATVTVLVVRRVSARAAAYGALVATGVGFAVMKALPAGALAASAVWSLINGPSVILADRTDLAALPALAAAAALAATARRRPVIGRAWRPPLSVARRLTPPSSIVRGLTPPSDIGRRLTPAVGVVRGLRPASGIGRRLALLVVLPAALLAMAATSAPSYPTAVAVATWRSMIVVGEVNAYREAAAEEPGLWRASGDGGRTWRYLTPAEEEAFTAQLPASAGRQRQQCAPEPAEKHCYRVRPGQLWVDESTDGGRSWAASWSVSDDRRDLLARSYEQVGDVREFLSARALAVAPQPGGHVVVVATGRDGYAVRDAAGRWERIGFGTTVEEGREVPHPPPPLDHVPAALVYAKILLGLLGAAVAVGAGFGWAARRGPARWLGLGLVTTAPPVTLFGVLGLHSDDGLIQLMAGALASGAVLVAMGVVVGTVVAALSSDAVRLRWIAALLLVGLATAAAGMAPFLLSPMLAVDLLLASLLALAVAIVGVGVALGVGAAARREPPPRQVEPPYPPVPVG